MIIGDGDAYAWDIIKTTSCCFIRWSTWVRKRVQTQTTWLEDVYRHISIQCPVNNCFHRDINDSF